MDYECAHQAEVARRQTAEQQYARARKKAEEQRKTIASLEERIKELKKTNAKVTKRGNALVATVECLQNDVEKYKLRLLTVTHQLEETERRATVLEGDLEDANNLIVAQRGEMEFARVVNAHLTYELKKMST